MRYPVTAALFQLIGNDILRNHAVMLFSGLAVAEPLVPLRVPRFIQRQSFCRAVLVVHQVFTLLVGSLCVLYRNVVRNVLLNVCYRLIDSLHRRCDELVYICMRRNAGFE